MCGIAGIITKNGASPDEGLVRRMTQAVAHRGPDGEGIWVKDGVGLGHRRLAIVDLSDTGIQPMTTKDGRFTIAYNGEIYNFRELRAELEASGASFQSTSDTEVILEAFRKWEEDCVLHLRGMFAFAIWDNETKQLFFSRDRIGKKPFFYRILNDGSFAFASELKALTPLEETKIDEGALRLFIGLQYVPSPRTGFLGISSLPPGYRGFVRGGDVRTEPYNDWDKLRAQDVKDIDGEIRSRLEDAVRLRLLADVPVGAFLSGGVDSAAIVALASKHVDHPLRTFTMGFPDVGMDERAEARNIASAFKTDHMEFEAKPQDLAHMAEQIVTQYDAPYADSSALPLMLLAKETASEIKVVLTGDGGDETFGGYRRYAAFSRANDLRRAGISWFAINAAWGAYWMRGNDPRFKRFAQTLEGLRKSYGRGYADLFTGSYFTRDDVGSLLQPEFLSRTAADDATEWIASQYREQDGVAGALTFDLMSYLPDDLNVKMDRATMAYGLEARAPFLDQEVVAFAQSLPWKEKVNGGNTKIALKRALKGIVSDDILERPKRGFQVPLAAWFRGPLKQYWRDRCLDPKGRLAAYVRLDTAEQLFKENERGVDHGNRLWMLLSLSLWLQRYG
jgi:asparagine synthase (glutamine-hydrolysing)